MFFCFVKPVVAVILYRGRKLTFVNRLFMRRTTADRILGIQYNMFVFQFDRGYKPHVQTSDGYLFDKLASTARVNLRYQNLNC
jgi:hypothetical protein